LGQRRGEGGGQRQLGAGSGSPTPIVVDGPERLQEQLAEIGESGGAAGGNAAVGRKDEGVGQGEIEAGAGAKVGDGAENLAGEGLGDGALEGAELHLGVMGAELRVAVAAEHAAAAFVGGAVVAAGKFGCGRFWFGSGAGGSGGGRGGRGRRGGRGGRGR